LNGVETVLTKTQNCLCPDRFTNVSYIRPSYGLYMRGLTAVCPNMSTMPMSGMGMGNMPMGGMGTMPMGSMGVGNMPMGGMSTMPMGGMGMGTVPMNSGIMPSNRF
jgi:hypothetical protein